MRINKLTIPICLSSSLLLVSACSPAQPSLNQLNLAPEATTPKQQTSTANEKSSRFVKFNVIPPAAEFGIKQTAQANYIKLTAVNGNQVIYDSNADSTTKMVQVVNSAATFSLGAQIPTGNNWVVTVGFYSNPSSPPILELKNAFHVPLTGTVNVSMQTHLTGGIVEELHKLNSTLLNNPLDLNAYQSFVNGLTGATVNGETLSFTRLTALDPATPQALSARALAVAINLSTIANVNNAAGTGLTPANYKQTPFPVGRYATASGTFGVDQVVAINPNNGWTFFSESLAGDADLEKVYGITTTTTADGSTGFNKFSEIFAPTAAKQILSPSLVLGSSNPTGGAMSGSVYYLELEPTPTDLTTPRKARIQAIGQGNGQAQWSYTFPFTAELYPKDANQNQVIADPSKAPLLLWRDLGTNLSCHCDDEDIVYAYVLAGASSGVYAIRQERPGGAGTAGTTNGTQIWSYLTSDLIGGGAVATDGSKLYFVTNNSSAGKLLILNRSDGTLALSVNLGAGSQTSPAIGTDGTVYVMTNNGILKAFDANGTSKWNANLGNIPFKHTPIVDRQNGKDVIYMISSSGTTSKSAYMYAYGDDGTAKWTSPIQLSNNNNQVYANLLVGAEPDGKRLIYTGLSNSKLYAVRDLGTKGQIEWETSAGGNLWNGLNLRNGYLYASTVDGGDRQFIMTHAIQVSTPNLPAAAPWPKAGGNLRNSGVSYNLDPEAANLRNSSVP
jgi:hypothetical protein